MLIQNEADSDVFVATSVNNSDCVNSVVSATVDSEAVVVSIIVYFYYDMVSTKINWVITK